MSLVFIGIDPNTGDKQSPTVWVDRDSKELVLQGWKASPELEAEAAAFTVPGHAVGIPENEAVIRIPARMVEMIREACDAVERADLR
ncbi:hypothetical protein [Streptomyces brevispora]|uniref:Uncharacterized protein n=1 Tax=Streptomyces brevispora TaxID=887462 RepID=A0A561UZ15_9ACTN|nr:hypothetical protein [Streptomyces brevispora]TWG04574.1 hypothetical protein FHX80_113037 [Streptomyces brevispora]WSC14316.1 hypothetical protein OIE64_16690 [Streptomyces brevispora]